ncbi:MULTISPECIES: hypothetical protein [Spirulina sp. CCY15215]|uniref:hypothetical protein n=1 Tax=Spirulina sp. CCY15215 TaxID=2767591 RepID=UPI00195034E9|nr:hypothetical protein [Spirulina major]
MIGGSHPSDFPLFFGFNVLIQGDRGKIEHIPNLILKTAFCPLIKLERKNILWSSAIASQGNAIATMA